jgi:carboxymethylenebutenolidase
MSTCGPAGLMTSSILWAVSVLALVETAPQAAAAPVKVKQTTDKYTCASKSIKVECFEPVVGDMFEGKFPAIVLLHDSAGLGLPMPGPFYRLCCQMLAREGYVVLLVHYLDQTGHKQVTPKQVTRENFKAWRDTVRQAVKYLARHKHVDPLRIGLLGFSLGAYLSLAVAGQTDLKIAAVGEFFGGLHEDLRKEVKTLPPTLIVHGDKDKVVPIQQAFALKKFLESRKLKFEMLICAGQEHMFRGESMTSKVLRDVQRSTLLFFANYLKNAGSKKENK